MDHDRLFSPEHGVQVRHRRIERKEIIELERRGFAIQRQRIFGAEREPIRIADRSHRRKSVQRAAKNDREKARVATLRPR